MSLDAILYGIEPLMKYELFTVRQIKFLIKLHEAGGEADSGIIGDMLPVQGAVVSRIIDSLSVKGFVTRRRWEKDRRFCRVSITDAGRNLIRVMSGMPAREAS